MDVRVIDESGVREHRADELPALLAGPGIVWVDIPVCDDEAVRVLTDVFRCHPLAVRDCVERNRVPRVRLYPEHVFLIGVRSLDDGERDMIRRALAGMLWSKQYYAYDVEQWLREHGPDARGLRNADWIHLRAADVISMPDTWEYPWFAAWDLAFHTIPLAMVDLPFAKQQL